MATNKNYVEQMNNKYAKQLKGLLDEMPDFCVEYFDSLEFNKQARTKIAYALDIKGFFEYLIDDTKKFANYAIKDFRVEDLDKITGQDISNYLRYIKSYNRHGKDVSNSASSAKRKLCALRRFYN